MIRKSCRTRGLCGRPVLVRTALRRSSSYRRTTTRALARSSARDHALPVEAGTRTSRNGAVHARRRAADCQSARRPRGALPRRRRAHLASAVWSTRRNGGVRGPCCPGWERRRSFSRPVVDQRHQTSRSVRDRLPDLCSGSWVAMLAARLPPAPHQSVVRIGFAALRTPRPGNSGTSPLSLDRRRARGRVRAPRARARARDRLPAVDDVHVSLFAQRQSRVVRHHDGRAAVG